MMIGIFAAIFIVNCTYIFIAILNILNYYDIDSDFERDRIQK
jgi:hypothetical protein